MVVNKTGITCGKLTKGVLAFGLLFAFCLVPQQASAQLNPFESLSTSKPSASGETCGPQDRLTYSVGVGEVKKGSDLYLKTNANDLTTNIEVFADSKKTGCVSLGSVRATDDNYVKISNNKDLGEEVIFTLASKKLGADIYASVATILLVENDLCQPQGVACVGRFMGKKGAIEPKTTSQPADFITVHTIPDISAEEILYVEYFDNGKFLYANSAIEPVNRNYLRGGEREVVRSVYLTNNNLFTISGTVKMPKDPLYSQYVKSSIYRLSGQARLIAILAGLLIAGGIILFAVRKIHHVRTYKNGHGIDRYLQTHRQ